MNTKITKRAIVMAAGMLVLASGAALGQDMGSSTTTVTANVGGLGSRVVAATPVAMTSGLGSETISGSLAVTVVEAVRTGTNPWSVTAVLDADLINATSDVITADNLAVTPGDVTQVLSGGTAAEGAAGTLDTPQTLFEVSGQSTSLIYSGDYAQSSALELTVPAGSATGTYTADLTVTLVQ